MLVIYEVVFVYAKQQKDEPYPTRILPEISQDTNPLNLEDIRKMEAEC